MAHPHRDALFRVRGGEAGQHLPALGEENPGTPPIGGCSEAGELHGAGKAQPRIHRRGHELAVGIGGRDPRHRFGIRYHQVVAALGLERHLVAEGRDERLRIGAGAYDRGVS